MTHLPPIQILPFAAGHIQTPAVRFFAANGNEETRAVSIPNTCYLIRHPQGLLLWDAGLPDSIAALPQQTLKRGKFRFTLERTLAGQLAEAGIAPDEVRYLAISHLHIDHVGNSALFRNATVILQETEHRAAFYAQAHAHGYTPGDYAGLSAHTRWLLPGDRDIFGDGRVVILSAPGHTPGHQVLFVDQGEAGCCLFSGDLYYQQSDIASGWIPVWNHDREITWRTMQRLEAFRASRGARWIVNHDPTGVDLQGK